MEWTLINEELVGCMETEKKIAKGDTLIWVSRLDNLTTRRDVIVEKVGRKWVTIVNGRRNWRADVVTLKVDCSGGLGYCFRSEEDLAATVHEYHREQAAGQAWNKLKKRMSESWRKPDKLTEGAILQAMTALGWNEPPPTTAQG